MKDTNTTKANNKAKQAPPLTIQGVISLVGTRKRLNLGKLSFEVFIKDYRHSYGNHRFLVTPVSGSGEQWVQKIEGIEGIPSVQEGRNKKGNPHLKNKYLKAIQKKSK